MLTSGIIDNVVETRSKEIFSINNLKVCHKVLERQTISQKSSSITLVDRIKKVVKDRSEDEKQLPQLGFAGLYTRSVSIVENLVRIPKWLNTALHHRDIECAIYLFRLVTHVYRSLLKRRATNDTNDPDNESLSRIFLLLREILSAMKPSLCQCRELLNYPLTKQSSIATTAVTDNVIRLHLKVLTDNLKYIESCRDLISLVLSPEHIKLTESPEVESTWQDRFSINYDKDHLAWNPFTTFFPNNRDGSHVWKINDVMCNCKACVSMLESIPIKNPTYGDIEWKGLNAVPRVIIPITPGEFKGDSKSHDFLNAMANMLNGIIELFRKQWPLDVALHPMDLIKFIEFCDIAGVKLPLQALRTLQERMFTSEESSILFKDQYEKLIAKYLITIAEYIVKVTKKAFVTDDKNVVPLIHLMDNRHTNYINVYNESNSRHWIEFHLKYRETRLVSVMQTLLSNINSEMSSSSLRDTERLILNNKGKQVMALLFSHVSKHIKVFLETEFLAFFTLFERSNLADLLAHGACDPGRDFTKDETVIYDLLQYPPLARAYNTINYVMLYFTRWKVGNQDYVNEIKKLVLQFMHRIVVCIVNIPPLHDLFNGSPPPVPTSLKNDFPEGSLSDYDDWRHILMVRFRLLKSTDANLAYGVTSNINRRLSAWSTHVLFKLVFILIPYFSKMIKTIDPTTPNLEYYLMGLNMNSKPLQYNIVPNVACHDIITYLKNKEFESIDIFLCKTYNL